MSTVATDMPDQDEGEYCSYASAKLDSEVLRLAKAASALAGKSIQEWLSDLANDAAAKSLGRKPIKRKPPKPKEKPDD